MVEFSFYVERLKAIEYQPDKLLALSVLSSLSGAHAFARPSKQCAEWRDSEATWAVGGRRSGTLPQLAQPISFFLFNP
jgi:hypothetical protein